MFATPNRASDAGPEQHECPAPDFTDYCFYAEDAVKNARRLGKSQEHARRLQIIDAIGHLTKALEVL